MSNPEAHTRWLRRPGWLLASGVFMVLFVALLIAAVRWNRQQRLIADIEAVGGQVETTPVGPAWLRSALGEDHMRGWDRIVGINLADCDVDDRWLQRILYLQDLEWIDLTATGVSERGLARVAELSALKQLYIEETAVSDEALADLDAAHPDVTLIRGRRAPIATALAMRRINRHALTCAVFSPDDRWIACGDGDGNLMMWDRTAQRWRPPIRNAHENWLFDARYSPAGDSLVTVGGDNAVCIWDMTDNTRIARLTPHSDDVHAVVISPDGNSIITAGDDCTIGVTDRLTGASTRWTAHDEAVTSLALSPDGRILVSGSRDDTVKFWDRETGRLTACLGGHTADVHAVACSADGRWVASASYDNTVRIYRASGDFVRELTGHTDWVFTVAFSPDGNTLASGSGDGTVRLWDTGSGECQNVLERQRTVSSVSFSHDGACLASAAADGNLCLWDPTDGRLLDVIGTPFRAHP
jgi:hypothetical protein